jgi:hypothetical protein
MMGHKKEMLIRQHDFLIHHSYSVEAFLIRELGRETN